MCNDCMFNTTGKHCHECKSGFKGDALKRTCLLFTKETPIDITINSNYNFEYSSLNNRDVPKKRIPRAQFHGIILDFVESGIAHKVESPYFCLKSAISTEF